MQQKAQPLGHFYIKETIKSVKNHVNIYENYNWTVPLHKIAFYLDRNCSVIKSIEIKARPISGEPFS